MKSRRWCFTDYEVRWQFNDSTMSYLVFQREECPKTKRLHYQGFVVFKAPRTMKWIKKHISDKAHLEIAKGSVDSAVAYCSKVESRVEGPYIFGEKPAQGKRMDLIQLGEELKTKRIDTVIREGTDHWHTIARHMKFAERLERIYTKDRTRQFRKVQTTVLYGLAGTGKTRYCFDRFDAKDVYKLDGWKKDSLWFDGYEGEKVLLIDDFYGWLKWGLLLKILDGYQLRLEVKGSTTYAEWTHVVITSNKPPDQWYQKGCPPELARRLHKIIRFTETGTEVMGGNTETPITTKNETIERLGDYVPNREFESGVFRPTYNFCANAPSQSQAPGRVVTKIARVTPHSTSGSPPHSKKNRD